MFLYSVKIPGSALIILPAGITHPSLEQTTVAAGGGLWLAGSRVHPGATGAREAGSLRSNCGTERLILRGGAVHKGILHRQKKGKKGPFHRSTFSNKGPKIENKAL